MSVRCDFHFSMKQTMFFVITLFFRVLISYDSNRLVRGNNSLFKCYRQMISPWGTNPLFLTEETKSRSRSRVKLVDEL